jgi:PAS domain S-box-containing protein
VPTAERHAAWRRPLLGFLLVGTLLGVLAAAIAVVVTRRLARPIADLAAGSQAMLRGEPVAAGATSAIAEVRQLRQALLEGAEKAQAYYAARERARVAEETAAAIAASQAALRVSEEKFAKAFQVSPDSVTITTLAEGRILEVNEGFQRLTGYSREEAIGRTLTELGVWTDPADREAMRQEVLTRGRVRDREFRFTTRAGTGLVGLVSVEIVELQSERVLLAVVRDVTERQRTMADLQEALAHEREMVATNATLLREVHHRVKNNLQILCDLLYLQMEAVKDAERAAILRDTYGRIYAIARLHEQLYQSMRGGAVDLGEYLGRLAQGFATVYSAARIILNAAPGVSLDVDRAIHVGLIITELVTNAMKHAFPSDRPGTVAIDLREEGMPSSCACTTTASACPRATWPSRRPWGFASSTSWRSGWRPG